MSLQFFFHYISRWWKLFHCHSALRWCICQLEWLSRVSLAHPFSCCIRGMNWLISSWERSFDRRKVKLTTGGTIASLSVLPSMPWATPRYSPSSVEGSSCHLSTSFARGTLRNIKNCNYSKLNFLLNKFVFVYLKIFLFSSFPITPPSCETDVRLSRFISFVWRVPARKGSWRLPLLINIHPAWREQRN